MGTLCAKRTLIKRCFSIRVGLCFLCETKKMRPETSEAEAEAVRALAKKEAMRVGDTYYVLSASWYKVSPADSALFQNVAFRAHIAVVEIFADKCRVGSPSRDTATRREKVTARPCTG
jgi:hypothetical protein